jgi:hypothetical protein
MSADSIGTGAGIRSPTSSALLREPLLKSVNKVTLRIASSSSNPKLPKASDAETETALSFVQQLRRLPKEVYVVLVVDFLNSYRSFGFRTVQYQYLTNEFGLDDLEAGSLLGMQAWLLVVFGIVGAMLVDAFGVRATALSALSVAAISRGILTFCRSREAMTFALLGLAPFGEAVLSTGIYTVALKKLTTRANRSFAFGIQYGVFNLSGALADVAADALRPHDFQVPDWLPSALLGGQRQWSGLRVQCASKDRTHLLSTRRLPLICPPPDPSFRTASLSRGSRCSPRSLSSSLSSSTRSW